MKRSRLFLILVLILLVINSLFFVIWYGFDGKGKVRALIEKEAGKALKGDFRIGTFSINDRQAFAEDVTFKARDGNLSFTVDQARVRFNLFRFIFSGFRINHILNEVTITKPEVSLKVPPSEKKKKAPKRFEIPDLKRYFNKLTLTDGSVDLDIGVLLNIGGEGILSIQEKLSAIQIKVTNQRRTDIKLDAVSATGGKFTVTGYLDKGRVADAYANIASYQPLRVEHPMLQNASTEVNLTITANQAKKNGPFDINGRARLTNTQAYVLDRYQVRLPFIVAESDGDKLGINLSEATMGNSSIAGKVTLTGLQKDLFIRSGSLTGNIDLGMVDPGLSGIVTLAATASGTIKKPQAQIRASASAVNVFGQQISDIALNGEYEDKLAEFELTSATWQNHRVNATGKADLALMTVSAKLGTQPLGPAFGSLKVASSADVNANLAGGLPDVQAVFHDLNVQNGSISLNGMTGYANLISSAETRAPASYYIDCDLASNDGQHLSVLGDMLDRNLSVSAEFAAISLADIIPGEAIKAFSPRVKGNVEGFITGDKIVASTELYVTTGGNVRYRSAISAKATYDIGTGDAGIILAAPDGSLNDESLALKLVAQKRGNTLAVNSLRINDRISVSANLDLKHITASSFNVMVRDISTRDVLKFIPGEPLKLPDISGVTLLAEYDPDPTAGLRAYLKVGAFAQEGLKPLSADIDLRGPPGAIKISGSVNNPLREVISLSGVADLSKGYQVDATGLLANLSPDDILINAPLQGGVSGSVGFSLKSTPAGKPDLAFTADVSAPLIRIPGVPDLDGIYLKARQSSNGIAIDTLTVSSGKLASVSASGILDYNPLTGEIGDGRGTMRVQARGDLLPWLNREVKYITDAAGKAQIDCEIGTAEGQFRLAKGSFDVRDGYLTLKDQSEPITDITVRGSIQDNRVALQNAGFRMGGGKAEIVNYFDDDPADHFLVGFLDLGCFRISIPEPGIKANIPFFTIPRSLSNIVISGQSLPYATVTGPFDDMKIAAKVVVSESEALYPPDTDNLLNLISSFRGALTKPSPQKESAQPAPLPFSMDLMVQLQDNVKYMTYPARLNIVPGSFLHITYEDQEWVLREANFTVDRGSIEFLGTAFQTDYLDITMLDAQNVFVIDGSFYKRSPDGTIVTLSVTTSRDTSLPIFDRLEFNLSSDNPRDRNISQILARLGGGGSTADAAAGSEGDLLQDEALNLISDNLNTSILSPFLYPIENQVRRLLKLDGFSIKAGFIQNLFMQYTSDPNQVAEYMDMQQFMDDITRFSSSILLNNFSISASKYLGRKMFLDYQLSLQEATDLQKKTRILVSHDTSLRMFLPRQFRLAYTFKYEPQDDQITHEVMLQRSFRFWGL